MKAIAMQYFQDSRGRWHQPGCTCSDFDDQEAARLEASGAITIVRTAMVRPPESRIKRGRK
jgi:hypothetical protein